MNFAGLLLIFNLLCFWRFFLMSISNSRYVCYEKSVNGPRADLAFLLKVYYLAFHRKALSFREDFCGTAALACAFVRSDPERIAVGCDNDQEVIDWSQNLGQASKLSASSDRLTFQCTDSFQTVLPQPFDIIAAFNYALCYAHERSSLLQYLRTAKAGLHPKHGMLVCDMYGGYAAHQERVSKRDYGEFQYIWRQEEYDFVSNIAVNSISFKFKDGSQMKRVFSYVFRLWSLKEIEEAMLEVGFRSVHLWIAESDGEGNIGEFIRRTELKGDIPTFNAFIVATIVPTDLSSPSD